MTSPVRCRAVRLVIATLAIVFSTSANAFDFSQCEGGRKEAQRLTRQSLEMYAMRFNSVLATNGDCGNSKGNQAVGTSTYSDEFFACINKQKENNKSVNQATLEAKKIARVYSDKAFKIYQYLEKSGCALQ